MNPFRRRHNGAPVLAMVTWVYVLWSLLPVLIAVRISFNDGRSRSSFQKMSFRWYWGDPNSSLWHDDSMQVALLNTLRLAGLASRPLGAGTTPPAERFGAVGDGHDVDVVGRQHLGQALGEGKIGIDQQDSAHVAHGPPDADHNVDRAVASGGAAPR